MKIVITNFELNSLNIKNIILKYNINLNPIIIIMKYNGIILLSIII